MRRNIRKTHSHNLFINLNIYRNRRLARLADRNDDLMRKNASQMDIKDRQVLNEAGKRLHESTLCISFRQQRDFGLATSTEICPLMESN